MLVFIGRTANADINSQQPQLGNCVDDRLQIGRLAGKTTIQHWLSFHPLCIRASHHPLGQTRLFPRPLDLLTPMTPPLIRIALKPRLSVAPPHTMQKKQTSLRPPVAHSLHPTCTELPTPIPIPNYQFRRHRPTGLCCHGSDLPRIY